MKETTMNDQKDLRPEGENVPENEIKEAQNTSAVADPAPKEEKKKSKLDFSNIEINLASKSFIKSAALVLISLLLLIFAFCPVINYSATEYFTYYDDGDFEYEENKISIGHSAAKGVGLFFDALSSKSEKQLKKLDLYDDLEDVVEDLYEEKYDIEDGEVTKKYQKLQKEYMDLTLRMTLKTEEVSPSLDGYFTPVFAIVYIIAAIALFLFSLLGLFYEVMGIDNLTAIKLLSKESVSKLSLKLLAAIPGLILVIFAFMFVGFGMNDLYGLTGILFKSRLAVPAIISLVLSLGSFIALMVLRVIDKEMVIDKPVIRRIISVALALVFLFVAFAPFASAKMDGDYTVTEKSMKIYMNANTFQGFRIDDYSALRVVPTGASHYGLGDLDVDLIDDGEADVLKFVFTCMILPWLAMVIFAIVILVVNVYQLGTGLTKGKKQLAIRITNMVLSLVTSGILIFWALAFALIDNEYISGSFSMSFLFYIVIAILFLVFMPLDPKEPVAENEADGNETAAAAAASSENSQNA